MKKYLGILLVFTIFTITALLTILYVFRKEEKKQISSEVDFSIVGIDSTEVQTNEIIYSDYIFTNIANLDSSGWVTRSYFSELCEYTGEPLDIEVSSYSYTKGPELGTTAHSFHNTIIANPESYLG